MNCRTCGYRLWNLPPGACPECGSAFKPSDYEFRRDAVQFVCPHCTQDYYGTDERGHLVPRAFTCVRCSEPIEMDRMLVRPAAGVDEDRTGLKRNPWVDRRRSGFLRGLFFTIGHAMVLPHRLIDATPASGGTGDAISFLAVTQFLYHALNLLPFALLMLVLAGVFGPGGGAGPAWEPVLMFGTFFVVALVATLGIVGVWILTAHGVLRLTGGAAHGLGRTAQCLCYSSAANCVVAIPCLGYYLGIIGWAWWVVSAAIMVARGQRVGGFRASVAVLLLPLVMIVALAGGIAWAVTAINTVTANANAALQTQGVQTLAVALRDHAAAHSGQAPAHASALLAGTLPTVTAMDFVSYTTLTGPADIPLGGGTLEDLDAADADERARLTDAAAAAQPASLVAHRVGDFVFTCHGFSLASPPDPGLWIVVESPDPVTNGQGLGMLPIAVARADLTTAAIPAADFPNEMQQQNTLRAQHGLPPLPDPVTVTHARPAVAP